jgi:hypothetical protein
VSASLPSTGLAPRDAMNISNFSLFGTVDSNVSALALKEVWLKEMMLDVLSPLEDLQAGIMERPGGNHNSV